MVWFKICFRFRVVVGMAGVRFVLGWFSFWFKFGFFFSLVRVFVSSWYFVALGYFWFGLFFGVGFFSVVLLLGGVSLCWVGLLFKFACFRLEFGLRS